MNLNSCNPSENWSVSSAPVHEKQSEEQSFDAVIMKVSVVVFVITNQSTCGVVRTDYRNWSF